jgi:hypothetical protein
MAAAFEVVSPTAVQAVVEVQATEKRKYKPAGALWSAQVAPPLVVAKMVTAPPPAELDPTAMQVEVLGHESPPTVRRPEGTGWLAQVAPPSLVPTITGALWVVVSPSTSQAVLEAHEMAESGPTPLGRLWVTQVAPPSLERTTMPGPTSWPGPTCPALLASPTAVHTEGEGHETAARLYTPVGRAKTLAQVFPPSVVRTTAPGPYAVEPPTARHSVVEGHDTALRDSTGALWAVQPVGPARAIWAFPTAAHTEVLGHDTPSRGLVVGTGFSLLQPGAMAQVPLKSNVMATPPPLIPKEPTKPTAVHSAVDGHETPVRAPPCPWNSAWVYVVVNHVAPPSVVTAVSGWGGQDGNGRHEPVGTELPAAAQSVAEGHEIPHSV